MYRSPKEFAISSGNTSGFSFSEATTRDDIIEDLKKEYDLVPKNINNDERENETED